MESCSASEPCFPVLSSGVPEQRHVQEQGDGTRLPGNLEEQGIRPGKHCYLSNLGHFNIYQITVTRVVIVILKILPSIFENMC